MLANDNTATLHLIHSQNGPLPAWGQGSPRVAAASVLGMLPAMDNAILLLQVLLASPVVNLRAVADVVRNDIGLTVELLRVVCRDNGGDQEIETSVTSNVIHAGLDNLKHLAGKVEPVSAYLCKSADLRHYEHFWGQARLTGLIAEELAYRANNIDPQAAYVAGLVCRIGELPVILGADRQGTDVASREVGRLLAKTWHFPRLLEDIVYGDEAQAASESLPLLALVQVADRQAQQIHHLAVNFARGVF